MGERTNDARERNARACEGKKFYVAGPRLRVSGKYFTSPDRAHVSGERISRRVTEVLCSGTTHHRDVTSCSRERIRRQGERDGCHVDGMAFSFQRLTLHEERNVSRRPGPRSAGRCRTDAPVDHLRTSRESASTRRTSRELEGSECAID
jgi:hypothetical protein